jgi:hypothetical protein
MTRPGAPDKTPWDKKTADERASCLLDHLAHEWVSGNLRPVSGVN